MIDRGERQLALVNFGHYRQMRSGLHQERRARVTGEDGRIIHMLLILDIRNRTHFFDRPVPNDQTTTLVRKLALRLRYNLLEIGPFN
jgi:hypothetical protein